MSFRMLYNERIVRLLKTISFIFILIISLSGQANPQDVKNNFDQKKPTIYFSAITLYHPIVMYQKYQPLMQYLTDNTPYTFELKLSQNYEDIINFLKKNEVQVALLGGVTYIEAKKEFKIIPILKPLNHEGETFYRSIFIARSNNTSVLNLQDLAGKSVAFASKRSTSGFLVPVYEMYSKAGITLDRLSSYYNFRYHDSVAREVLKGHYDAGAVIDSVANRFMDKGLKAVYTSDPIPGLPIVVREDAEKELITAIKKALLKLDYSDYEDRKIMDEWDEELKYGFAAADDPDYDGIRKMIDFLKINKAGLFDNLK